MEDMNEEIIGEKKEKVSNLKRLLNEVSQESLSLSDNILSLQSKLINASTYDEYPKSWIARKRRRLSKTVNDQSLNLDDICKEMNEDWNDFIPYSNNTMDIWDRKMRLIENYAHFKEKKQQNQQSLLKRTAMMIENPFRILQKMQSVDKQFHMFGDSKEITIVANDERNKNDKQLKYELYKFEPEMFNDGQFYRRLLKEIIDIGDNQSTNFTQIELHHKMDEVQRQKQEQKLSFQKAKMRMKYTIRPDMENFMAPRFTHDPDFKVQQLYNSLFL